MDKEEDEEEDEVEDEEDDGRQNRLVSVNSSSSSAWASELFLLPDKGPQSVDMRNCSSIQLVEGVDWGSGLSDLGPE